MENFSFINILQKRALEQPDQLAFIFLNDGETESGSLTYEALDRQARAIAARLQSLNLTGERALLLYPPGIEFISAFFGCLYAGVVAVPAYPPRRERDLTRFQAITADSQTKIALTITETLSDLQRRFPESLELNTISWLTTDTISTEVASQWQHPEASADTLAFLQYTSGSTAVPKGVMVTHGNLLHNSKLIYNCFQHSPESQGVIWLPPYHDMGLIGGLLQPVYGGFPVTLMSPVAFLQKPIRWLQAISRYKATTSGGPNFAYELCASKITPEQKVDLDLSSWEVAFNGAEPIRTETLERFATTFASCGFRSSAFYIFIK
ncbi:MAG: fatty acyl-AMP ligase [Moorea sp. SIO2B7]|nr:fatty acyl-AMP ligase [Moorena sp. SIO2B7]